MWAVALVALLCAAGAAAQEAAVLGGTQADRDALLAFKGGLTNFDEVAAARGYAGWCTTPGGPDCVYACGWSGVTCDRGRVSRLDLSCPLAGCAGGVPLRGTLGPGLETLELLQTLDLSGNELSGELPPEWGFNGTFPSVQVFDLSRNRLKGAIPDAWAYSGGFQEVVVFDLSRNALSGGFPAVAYTNVSFYQMQSFNIGFNNMSGPLPEFWNGLIILTVVNIESNRFTGTIPPDWGTNGYWYKGELNMTQAIQYFSIGGNQLTGGIPAAWAANGSFTALRSASLGGQQLGGTLPPEWGGGLPALEQLELSNAELQGTLPPQWGAGLPRLQEILLQGNTLTGSIPATWANLTSLQRIVLQPGNAELCPLPPSTAGFKVCKEGDVLCVPGSLPYTYDTCNAAPPPPDSGGSSFPALAVAVPCAVVGVAALGGAAWLWHRRRRRQQEAAAMQKASAHQDVLSQYGDAWGLAHSGDTNPHHDASPFASGGAIAAGAGSGERQHMDSGGSGCLPCFRSHSADLDMHHSGSTQPSGGRAATAPLWLPSAPAGAMRSGSTGLSGGGDGSGVLAPGWHPLPSHASEGSAAAQQATKDHQRVEALLSSEWQIPPEAIEFCKRPDGTNWQLGSGGFGTVYKAMRNGVTPVAVKVLGTTAETARKLMSDEDFFREIDILRACRDTNILQFQGACFKDDRALLVTEYMEGGNLTANLKARTVSWYRRGKKAALDVARALVYLHSRRIVHLDIKSANVLLTRDGTAKVGDVGMARIMGENNYVSGGTVGTLAWSAPELLLGRRCDGKADIYSFGVVLWEICTGLMPVRGQLREPDVPNECPQEVILLLRRCLDPDPAARPTAMELVQQLQLAPAAPPAGSAAAVALARRSMGGPRPGTGSGPIASPSRAGSVGLPTLPPSAGSVQEQVAAARDSGNWGAAGLPAGARAPSVTTPDVTLGEVAPLRPSTDTNPPTSGGPTSAGSGAPASAGRAGRPPPT